MVSFVHLREAMPELWSAAADDIVALAKHCERLVDDIHQNGKKPLDEHWRSVAYGAARKTLTNVADRTETTAILCRSVTDVLDTLHYAVCTAQSELQAGIQMAHDAGLEVDEKSGTVRGPASEPEDVTERALLERHRSQAQQLINDALNAANQADTECTQALAAVVHANPAKISVAAAQHIQSANTHRALEELRDTLPDGLPPEEVAYWWRHLSPEEQYDLARACPIQLSHLEGIPDSVKKDMDRGWLGYSSLGTVQYALANWNNKNIDWAGKNNCANFVSHSLAYGGGMRQKSDTVPSFDSDGWYGVENSLLPAGMTHTKSWGGAAQRTTTSSSTTEEHLM